MAAKHELEIEISAGGKIDVRVKGAKGKRCLEYVQLFNTVGKVANQQLTGEYYEPDPGVFIVDQTKTRTKL